FFFGTFCTMVPASLLMRINFRCTCGFNFSARSTLLTDRPDVKASSTGFFPIIISSRIGSLLSRRKLNSLQQQFLNAHSVPCYIVVSHQRLKRRTTPGCLHVRIFRDGTGFSVSPSPCHRLFILS